MGKSLCFTGHRPEKLMKQYDENSDYILDIKAQIKKYVISSINDGYDSFYSGVARGVDIFASEIVLELRKEYPNIKHIAVIPYLNQSLKWNDDWKMRYEKVIINSDIKLVLSQNYYNGCLWDRNEFMIENSHRVIAVYNGGHNGTYNTINLAKKYGKELVLINDIKL